MKAILSQVTQMFRTTYGRVGAALVLAFSMVHVAYAQQLQGPKGFLDRLQSPGNLGAGTQGQGNVNPFQGLYQQISSSTGQGGIEGVTVLFNNLLQTGVGIVTAIAVIFVIVAGVRMIIESSNEETAKKQTTMIFNVIAGVVIMNIANFGIMRVAPQTSESSVEGLLARFDTITGIRESALTFATTLVFPLLDFALSFLAGIAFLFIVYASMNIITHRGDEEKVKEARSRVIKTVIGIAVILLNKAFVGVFYGGVTEGGSRSTDLQPDIQSGVNLIFNLANYGLGFLGMVAVLMLIYGGVMMVASGGDEKKRAQGLKILQFVLYGIILAMSAYTLTSAIVGVTIRGA